MEMDFDEKKEERNIRAPRFLFVNALG